MIRNLFICVPFIERWKVKNCSLTEIFRGIELVIEAAILEPRTQVSGTVLLVDFDGLTINHVWQFTPNFAKLVLDWIQVKTILYSYLYTCLIAGRRVRLWFLLFSQINLKINFKKIY